MTIARQTHGIADQPNAYLPNMWRCRQQPQLRQENLILRSTNRRMDRCKFGSGLGPGRLLWFATAAMTCGNAASLQRQSISSLQPMTNVCTASVRDNIPPEQAHD